MIEHNPVSLVRGLLRDLHTNNRAILLLACRQRAKYEGWLKFELAASLQGQTVVDNVVLEGGYPKGGRADIVFRHAGRQCFVEMKTSNVSWRARGVENLTRPIKMNIDGIIEDIHKLQHVGTTDIGLMVFSLFPVPVRIWEKERKKLRYHLHRIEQETGLDNNILDQNAVFVNLEDEFGICLFVVDVPKVATRQLETN